VPLSLFRNVLVFSPLRFRAYVKDPVRPFAFPPFSLSPPTKRNCESSPTNAHAVSFSVNFRFRSLSSPFSLSPWLFYRWLPTPFFFSRQIVHSTVNDRYFSPQVYPLPGGRLDDPMRFDDRPRVDQVVPTSSRQCPKDLKRVSPSPLFVSLRKLSCG